MNRVNCLTDRRADPNNLFVEFVSVFADHFDVINLFLYFLYINRVHINTEIVYLFTHIETNLPPSLSLISDLSLLEVDGAQLEEDQVGV